MQGIPACPCGSRPLCAVRGTQAELARPRLRGAEGPPGPHRGFGRTFFGAYDRLVSVALKCTRCGAASVSSLFYRGPDAHVCRMCNAPFELADPARERRMGFERRAGTD